MNKETHRITVQEMFERKFYKMKMPERHVLQFNWIFNQVWKRALKAPKKP
jgi:hypothetical protein